MGKRGWNKIAWNTIVWLRNYQEFDFPKSLAWETLGWKKHKLASRLPGEISITSDMQMTPPYGKREEELKNLLMKVKEESEKVELELNIQ